MKKQRKFLYSVVVGMFLAVSLSVAPAKAEASWWDDLRGAVSGWIFGCKPFVGYSQTNCQYSMGRFESRQEACDKGAVSSNVEGDGEASCHNC